MNLVRPYYILYVITFILFANITLLSQSCRLNETAYISPSVGVPIITLLNEVQMEINSVIEGGALQTIRYQIDDPTYSTDFSNFYLNVKGVGIISPSADDLIAGWVEFEFTLNYSVGSGIGYDLYADANTMSGVIWQIDFPNSDMHCHEINQCQMTWFGSPSGVGVNQYQGSVSAAGNLQAGNDYRLAFAVESGDPTTYGSNYYIRVGSVATGTIVNATTVTADSIVFNFNTVSNLSGSIFHLFGDITSTGITFSLDEMQSILDCVPPSNTNACGNFSFGPGSPDPIGPSNSANYIEVDMDASPYLDAGVEQVFVFEIVGDLGSVYDIEFGDAFNGSPIGDVVITEDRIYVRWTPTVETAGIFSLIGSSTAVEAGLSFNFLETESDITCSVTLPITGLDNVRTRELNFTADVMGLWYGETDLLTAYFSLDGKNWSFLKTIEVNYDDPQIDISVPQSGYLKFVSERFTSDVYYLRSSFDEVPILQFPNPIFGIIKYPIPVKVFTTNGMQVAEGLEIDFDMLSSGVYLLRYNDGLHFKTVKLVHL